MQKKTFDKIQNSFMIKAKTNKQTKNLKICREKQKTLSSQSYLEKEKLNWRIQAP